MKMSTTSRAKLVDQIRLQIDALATSRAEISRQTRVDVGQVSRICRGQFKTLSHNVLQICKFLNIPIDDDSERGASSLEAHRRRLERGVVAIWDQSPTDADRIVRLLRDIAALRQKR
jgi:hypothetical protein